MDDAVILERQGHLAVLTLNRPDNRNAMTVELLDAFRTRVAEVKGDNAVRVLIVTGSGKNFCSGADFKATADLMTRSGMAGTPGMRESAKWVYGSFLALLELDIPVIAAMNGHAIGGGLGLALACDLRVAAVSARIGANFVRLGLHPGMAVSYLLPRLTGLPIAAELLFTGRIINGDEAARFGLVNYAVPEAEVMDRAKALATEIAACAPYAVRLTKRSLYNGLQMNPAAALETEAYAQALCSQTDDAKEGVMALMQKREPVFKGK
ncbi:MAG: enoyl-CoA hydratase/isomerase family protein [Deltaproteobacteria bacterium]|nr:enoyl-CoA hydratase/isomerase family protein [Deltaproteobacteria bacterium]